MSIMDIVTVECGFASDVPARSAQGLLPEDFFNLKKSG
jgi:hypothetical protein